MATPPPKQIDIGVDSADASSGSAPRYLIRRAKSSPGWVAALMFISGPIAGTFFAIRHRCKALALWPIGLTAFAWLIQLILFSVFPGLANMFEALFGLVISLLLRIVFASIGSAITGENKIAARKRLGIEDSSDHAPE